MIICIWMKHLFPFLFALPLSMLVVPTRAEAKGTYLSRSYDLRFSRDGSKLLSATQINEKPNDISWTRGMKADNRLRVYSPRTGRQTWVLPARPISWGPVELMPDFKTALTSSGEQEVKTLDIHRYTVTNILNPRIYYINDIELSPDGKTLLIGGSNIFKLFGAKTRRVLHSYYHGAFDSYVQFGPAGKTVILIPGRSGQRQVVDVATGKQVHGGGWVALATASQSFAFSRDGKLMARAMGTRVELWETPLPKGGRKLQEWDSKFSRVSKIAFSPDNRKLAVGGYSKDRVPVQFLRVANGN